MRVGGRDGDVAVNACRSMLERVVSRSSRSKRKICRILRLLRCRSRNSHRTLAREALETDWIN